VTTEKSLPVARRVMAEYNVIPSDGTDYVQVTIGDSHAIVPESRFDEFGKALRLAIREFHNG